MKSLSFLSIAISVMTLACNKQPDHNCTVYCANATSHVYFPDRDSAHTLPLTVRFYQSAGSFTRILAATTFTRVANETYNGVTFNNVVQGLQISKDMDCEIELADSTIYQITDVKDNNASLTQVNCAEAPRYECISKATTCIVNQTPYSFTRADTNLTLLELKK